jgi:hypothetical protein
MAFCRSCQARIKFVLSAHDRHMPVDWEPSETGTIELVFDDKGERRASYLSGPALALARAQHIDLYTSHFATCPQASKYRKARSPRKERTAS